MKRTYLSIYYTVFLNLGFINPNVMRTERWLIPHSMFVRDGESSDDDDIDVTSPPAYLGRDFQIRFSSFRVPEDRSYSQLLHWWSDKRLDYRDITWLSPPVDKAQELQITYSTASHSNPGPPDRLLKMADFCRMATNPAPTLPTPTVLL